MKAVLLFLLFLPAALHAENALKMSTIFTDHMVLQREMPVPVWGWANPGEEVSVNFAGQKKTAKADAVGKWMVKLDPMQASAESRDLEVIAPSGSLRLSDVLVGDVWLCTGQSNMGFGVNGSLNPEKEIPAANFPSIRFFIVRPNPVLEPAADVKGALKSGGWEVCSPQNVGDFSGVGYFFGREIHRDLKIPIGLLRTSLGGTEAEAWTSMEAQRALPEVIGRSEENFAKGKSQEEDNRKFVTNRAAWEEKYGVKPPPVSEAARSWADPDLDTTGWTVAKQAGWSQLGSKSGGVFWARKELMLPRECAGKPFDLNLGKIDEQYDTAYFNGVELAPLAPEQPPEFYFSKRSHRVPANLVKEGRNVIALRVVSATDRAAMAQLVRPLDLSHWIHPSSETPWLIRKELDFPPLTAEALASRPKPNTIWAPNIPSALFNGMVAPLIPFAVKGAIWYQGESNTPRPTQYRDLLAAMIADWRKRWGQGDFPFLIMQLVNNGAAAKDPNEDAKWPLVREAQEKVAATVPNSGLAVGIEIGSAVTIHPPDKQDAGKRLALVALEKVYGQQVESSGPRFESMKIEGPAIRLSFSHAKGLVAKAVRRGTLPLPERTGTLSGLTQSSIPPRAPSR